MRKFYTVLLLCVLLGFGMSVVISAEDVPDTAYDESESLLYEGVPVFSVALHQSARSPQLGRIVPIDSCPAGRNDEVRIERTAHPIFDSLIILDQTLRC